MVKIGVRIQGLCFLSFSGQIGPKQVNRPQTPR